MNCMVMFSLYIYFTLSSIVGSQDTYFFTFQSFTNAEITVDFKRHETNTITIDCCRNYIKLVNCGDSLANGAATNIICT